MQKVTMGFYREERVPNHSLFDLAYSCVGRYVGWTRAPFSCFWTDSKYWKGPVSSSFAPLPCTVYLVWIRERVDGSLLAISVEL